MCGLKDCVKLKSSACVNHEIIDSSKREQQSIHAHTLAELKKTLQDFIGASQFPHLNENKRFAANRVVSGTLFLLPRITGLEQKQSFYKYST